MLIMNFIMRYILNIEIVNVLLLFYIGFCLKICEMCLIFMKLFVEYIC